MLPTERVISPEMCALFHTGSCESCVLTVMLVAQMTSLRIRCIEREPASLGFAPPQGEIPDLGDVDLDGPLAPSPEQEFEVRERTFNLEPGAEPQLEDALDGAPVPSPEVESAHDLEIMIGRVSKLKASRGAPAPEGETELGEGLEDVEVGFEVLGPSGEQEGDQPSGDVPVPEEEDRDASVFLDSLIGPSVEPGPEPAAETPEGVTVEDDFEAAETGGPVPKREDIADESVPGAEAPAEPADSDIEELLEGIPSINDSIIAGVAPAPEGQPSSDSEVDESIEESPLPAPAPSTEESDLDIVEVLEGGLGPLAEEPAPPESELEDTLGVPSAEVDESLEEAIPPAPDPSPTVDLDLVGILDGELGPLSEDTALPELDSNDLIKIPVPGPSDGDGGSETEELVGPTPEPEIEPKDADLNETLDKFPRHNDTVQDTGSGTELVEEPASSVKEQLATLVPDTETPATDLEEAGGKRPEPELGSEGVSSPQQEDIGDVASPTADGNGGVPALPGEGRDSVQSIEVRGEASVERNLGEQLTGAADFPVVSQSGSGNAARWILAVIIAGASICVLFTLLTWRIRACRHRERVHIVHVATEPSEAEESTESDDLGDSTGAIDGSGGQPTPRRVERTRTRPRIIVEDIDLFREDMFNRAARYGWSRPS